MKFLLAIRVLVLTLVSCAIIFYLIRNLQQNISILILFSLLVRYLATTLLHIFPILPYNRDYEKYLTAVDAINAGWAGAQLIPIPLSGVVNIFSYLVAPIYLIAPSTITLELLNGFFGALIVYNIYRITSTIFDTRRAATATAIATIYPSFIHYTSILMRDALIILLISEILYILVAWVVENRSPRRCVIFVVLLVLLRPENIAFILPTITMAALVRERTISALRARIGAVISTFILGGISAGFIGFILPGELSNPDPQALSSKRAWLSRGTGDISGNYLSHIRFESWFDVIAFAPIGALYFLLVPFPWMIDMANPFMLIATVENLVLLYPVFFIMLYRLRYITRISRAELVLLTTLLFGTVSYGLVEGNMGPAMRHRLQFTFVMIILASPSIPSIIPFPNRLPCNVQTSYD